MLRNYFNTALRNLLRKKGISAINLLGLSFGLASCLVAILYIKNEIRMDQSVRDIESIYRVTTQIRTFSLSGTPYLMTETMQHDFAEVKDGLRMSQRNTSLKIKDQTFNHEVIFADPGYFDFFSFELERGDAKTVLTDLRSIVLSQNAARKYFGGEDPVGKVVQIKVDDRFEDFQVTGVGKDFEHPTSLYYDFLIPLENNFIGGYRRKEGWTNLFLTSYVKVDAAQIESFQSKLPQFVEKYVRAEDPSIEGFSFVLNPLSEHHLREGTSGSGLRGGIDTRNLYVFAGIAVIILSLAAFNFMNLTNAQSSKRGAEVGIRKVAGAVRAQLLRQFLSESLLVTILATLLAFGIAELSLMIFSDLLGVQLTVFSSQHIDVYLILLLVTFATGMLAGFYPAVVLSNLTTIQTFKRNFRVGGANRITRTVLTFQFLLSITLMVAAIAMWKQQDYMMKKDLGFNEEQILVIAFGQADSASVDVVKNQLAAQAGIMGVSKTSGSFTRGNAVSISTMPDQSRVFIYMQSIDENYINTMQMQLVQGRSFIPEDVSDKTKLIVNETLAKRFNIEDSVGIRLGRRIASVEKPVVIGVVKDFNHSSLLNAVEPMMMTYNTRWEENYLMVRLQPGTLTSSLEKARAVWSKINPDSPFDYYFLDEDLNKQYESERRWSNIITVATSVAIFLSVLGLIGLALYTAEQRRKEIGIRKVLGATIGQLLGLLSRDYLLLIGLAFIVAVPVSYYIITNYWLNKFAYRIEVDYFIYVMALLIIMLIAVIAVSTQTLRAALQNPTDILKEE